MKKLYLLRHAKSSRANFAEKDFLRNLDDKGKEDAKKIGRYMQANKFDIDSILCSAAKRTKETLDIILDYYEFQGQPVYKDSLYSSTPEILKNEIKELASDKVLLVGHNPEISILARNILGEDISFGTCNLIIIDMENYKMEAFIQPESIK